MKTADFIAKAARGELSSSPRNGWQKYARVAWDGSTLYSYGTHYPLLITIKGRAGDTFRVCNDRGYSVTTSKHIGTARRYADYCVQIPRTFSSSHAVTAAGILEAAEIERGELFETTERKRRAIAATTRTASIAKLEREIHAHHKRAEDLQRLIHRINAATA